MLSQSLWFLYACMLNVCGILCEMCCLCVMCYMLIWDNDIFDYVFCLCIIYAVIVSIYFNAVFWSNDSQGAEGHLSHVHWLWRLRNQIIDVLASNLELDIYWILHVKICITCRINPRTLYHPKGHRPEGWYRSRVDTACDTYFDM